MRKQLFAALLALVLCGTAAADLYVDIGITSPGDGWPYAPYVITPTSGAPSWMPATFDTFCVERYITFTPGNYRATIDEDILYAGVGGLTLADDAKKIYAAYLNGALGGISANTIQESVWGTLSYGSYSIDSTIAGIIGDNVAIAGWNDVKVLNLWGSNDQDIQSQMLMTPVPGAGLLGVIGIGFASLRLRRRKIALEKS
jgi:hypothetical protein